MHAPDASIKPLRCAGPWWHHGTLKDHTDHVIWLGPSETLNLAALE